MRPTVAVCVTHNLEYARNKSPAEADFQRYFRVSPPSVDNMIVTLDERGFISRERGRGRSIKLLVNREDIPDLD